VRSALALGTSITKGATHGARRKQLYSDGKSFAHPVLRHAVLLTRHRSRASNMGGRLKLCLGSCSLSQWSSVYPTRSYCRGLILLDAASHVEHPTGTALSKLPPWIGRQFTTKDEWYYLIREHRHRNDSARQNQLLEASIAFSREVTCTHGNKIG
jgi:hypothetical protein